MANSLSYTRQKAARYVRNVGKSFGYVVIEDLKPLNPAVSSVYEQTRNITTEAAAKAKEKFNRSRSVTDLSKKNNYSNSFITKLKSDLLSDLRSGKWYNKGRIDKENNAEFVDFDYDYEDDYSFNDVDDFGDYDYGDTESSSTKTKGYSQSKINKILSGKIDVSTHAASNAMSEATVRSADYIVESNRQFTKIMYETVSNGFSMVSAQLTEVNTGISALAAIARPLNSHMQNAANFYVRTSEYQRESLDLLRQIAANTAPIGSGGRNSGNSVRNFSDFFSNGNLNFKSLGGHVKKKVVRQIGDLFEAIGLGGLIGGGDGGGGGGANPFTSPISILYTALSMLTGKSIVPTKMKNSMVNFNKSIQGFFGSNLMKFKAADFEKYGIFGVLLKSLQNTLPGPAEFKKTFNPANYNKGKVDWDGVSRKALTEVIPTQLAKIITLLGGGEERRFNYSTGKWEKASMISYTYNIGRAKEVGLAGGDLYRLMSETIYNKTSINQAQKNQLQKNLYDFTSEAFFNSDGFEFMKLLSQEGNTTPDANLLRKYGFKNRQDFYNFKTIFKIVNNTTAGKTATTNFAGQLQFARDAYAKNLRQKEQSDSYEFSNLFNDSFEFENAEKKWIKNNPGKGVGILSTMTDDQNHNVFFYLQGIFGSVQYIAENMFRVGRRTKKGEKPSFHDIPKHNPFEYLKQFYIPKEEEGYENGKFETAPYIPEDITKFESILNDPDAPLDIKDTIRILIAQESTFGARGYIDPNESTIRSNVWNKIQKYQYDKSRSGILGAAGFNTSKIGNINMEKVPKFLRPIIERTSNLLNVSVDSVVDILDSTSSTLSEMTAEGIKSGFQNSPILSSIGRGLENIFISIADLLPGFLGKPMKKGYELFKNSKFWANAKEGLAKAGAWIVDPFSGSRDNGTAANGRQVTKTGVVAVSEGEMIIPSEYNPFYHGITNKAQQLRNERRAANRFFGYRADGDISLGNIGSGVIGLGYNAAKYGYKGGKAAIGAYEDISERAGEGLTTAKGFASRVVGGAANVGADWLIRLFGPKDEKEALLEKKKLFAISNRFLEEAGANKSGLAAGATVGAGVSLLTGAVVGPILGAGIGAATGLVVSSKKVQTVLFGEDVVNEETGKLEKSGGILNKKVSNFLAKQLPSITKGGIYGTVLGAVGGSPILGTILGSVTGFVSSSEKAKTVLFGEIDPKTGNRKGGWVPKKVLNALQSSIPKIGLGTALGAIAGPFGGVGPLNGIAVNAMVGAVAGFVADTNKFKNWFYGKEDPKTGERKGGFLDYTKKNLFQPIIESFNKVPRYVGQQFARLGKNLFRSLANIMLKSSLVRKTTGAIKKSRLGRIVGGAINGGLRGAVKLASTPFRAANAIIDRSALKRGYSLYNSETGEDMTIDERAALADQLGVNGLGVSLDTLYSSGDEQSREEMKRYLGIVANKTDLQYTDELRSKTVGLNNRFIELSRNAYNRGVRTVPDSLYVEAGKIIKSGKNPEEVSKALDRLADKYANKLGPQAAANIDKAIADIKEEAGFVDSALGVGFKHGSFIDVMNKYNANSIDTKTAAMRAGLSEKEAEFLAAHPEYAKDMLSRIDYSKLTEETRAKNKERAEAEDQRDINIQNASKGILDISSMVDKIYNAVCKANGLDIDKAGDDNPDSGFGDGEGSTSPLNDLFNSGDEVFDNGLMARGGRTRRGLAAVSRGELIVPRSSKWYGLFADGGIVGDDSLGESEVSVDQFGNTVENLGSSKVQKKRKFKALFASGLAGMASAAKGVDQINANLLSLKDAIVGNGEGKGGLVSNVLSFFKGGISSIISKGLKVAAPVIGTVIGAAILKKAYGGEYDTLAYNISGGRYGSGQDYVDSTGQYVSKDESGNWVHEDGTPAEGQLTSIASASTATFSDRLKQNTARAVINGMGGAAFRGTSVLGGAIKGLSKSVAGRALGASGASTIVKSAKKVAGLAKKGANAISNIKNSKIQNKALTEGLTESIDNVGVIGNIQAKLMAVARKLKSIPILGKAADVMESIFSEIGERVAKAASSGIGKKALTAAKSALKVFAVAMVVVDATTGYQDAAATFRVKNPTTAQKISSAIIRVVKNLSFVGSFIPDSVIADIVFKYIAPIFGYDPSSLKKQQDEAQQDLDDFNAENGTNYTWEEYNKQVLGNYTWTEKIGNTVKSGVSNLGETLKKGISKVGSGISTAKTVTKQIMSTASEKVTTAVDKVKPIVQSYMSAHKRILAATLKGDFEALNAITYEPAEGQDSTGITKILKVGIQIEKMLNYIPTLLGYIGNTIKDKVENSVLGKAWTGIKNVAGWVTETISGALKDNPVETDQSGSGSGFISQYDSRYSNKRLGYGTVSSNGCGPAAATMMLNQLSGGSMDSAIKLAGRYQTSGGTDASYFADEFARHGYSTNYSTDKRSILSQISNGKPLVLMGRDASNSSKTRSPFGPNNHYVVANGIDKSGKLIISDPEAKGTKRYSPAILNSVRLGISAGDSGTEEAATTSTSSGGNLISSLISAFGERFENIFSSGTTSTTHTSSSGTTHGGTSGTFGSSTELYGNTLTGKDPVSYMESMIGQVEYKFGGGHEPDKNGYADCSGMVNWAINKATNGAVGYIGDTGKFATSTKFVTVWDGNGSVASSVPDGVMRNDILLFTRPNSNYAQGRKYKIGHIGIYIGDGKYIDHGGPGDGPNYKTLTASSGLVLVRRLKDYNWGYGSTSLSSNLPTVTNLAQAESIIDSLKLSSSKKSNFYKAILPGVLYNKQKYGIMPSLSLAQSAIESSWGESGLSSKYNNLFGIKADANWTGSSTPGLTTSEESNGQLHSTTAKFRAYNSWSDSVADYGAFLNKYPRYRGVLSAKDYIEAAKAMGESGYATDSSYGDKIRNQIEHDKIYMLDNFTPSLAASGSGLRYRGSHAGMTLLHDRSRNYAGGFSGVKISHSPSGPKVTFNNYPVKNGMGASSIPTYLSGGASTESGVLLEILEVIKEIKNDTNNLEFVQRVYDTLSEIISNNTGGSGSDIKDSDTMPKKGGYKPRGSSLSDSDMSSLSALRDACHSILAG